MEQDLIFIGYRIFSGKKDTSKTYYVLTFLGEPRFSQDKNQCWRSNIDVFVTPEQYNKYIKEHDINTTYKVPFKVEGTNVRYFI